MTAPAVIPKRAALAERRDDLYETPTCAVRALLAVETLPSGVVWEPACGPGAIVRTLRAAGHEVYATDLVDNRSPDQDAHGVDFPDGARLGAVLHRFDRHQPARLKRHGVRVVLLGSRRPRPDRAPAHFVGGRTMSAPARCMRPDRPPATIDALTAKARTGAYLFEFGWLDLQSAVDQLQRYAERSGAVRELGADMVQSIISAAFEHIPREDF